MPWKSYVTNALVAGALAAGTNHLAIVAILHYILPRKKGEIARRIQEIIATDLISPEKMRDKFDQPEVAELLRRHIHDTIVALLSRDLPPPGILLADHAGELNTLARRCRDSLLDELRRRCDTADFSESVVRPFLAERWRALEQRTPASLFAGRSEELSGFAEKWTEDLERSEPLRRNVRRIFSEWLEQRVNASGNLSELLPSGLVAAAEELAAAQAPVIMEQLVMALRQPAIQGMIVTSIMHAIDDQLRGQGMLGDLKGILVKNVMRIERDVRGVCARLPDTLRENLNRPENRGRFAELLRGAVRSGLQKDFDAGLSTQGGRDRLVDLLLSNLWQPKNFRRIAGQARRLTDVLMQRAFAETVAKLGLAASTGAVLDEAAARCRRILVSPATRELLAGQFDELFAAWLDQPVGKLERFVTPAMAARASDVAAEAARRMIRDRLADFAEESGVWNIVTESIEGYDNRQLADMIKQLASTELWWVTILGGVIGVAVGLIQTFLQSL